MIIEDGILSMAAHAIGMDDAQYHVKVVAWVPNRNLEPWKGDAKS